MDDRERDQLVESALSDARLGTGGWWRAVCPFCPILLGKTDVRWSLGANAEGFYHCFRCGTSGRLRAVPEEFVGKAREAEENAPAPEDVPPPGPPEHYHPLWRAPALTALGLKPARRYLRSRGLGRRDWKDIGIGVCTDGFFHGRIIVPIFATDGFTWLGFAARDWTGGQEPKYLYPKGMKRDMLYEHRALLEESDEPLILVEGTFDAMPYRPDSSACLGKPNKNQVEALKEAKRPIAVCLDGDAHVEAYALAMILRLNGVRAGSVRLPPKKDPAVMALEEGPDWLRTRAKECIDA